MKKFLSAVVSAAICLSAFSAVPAGAVQPKIDSSVISAEKVTASGTCGTNVNWTLEGGTLTISGNGKISSWLSSEKVPWKNHKSEITSVVIEKGVTSIGTYTFMGCNNLTSVTIADSVTDILMNAFSLCSSLNSIVLPASVANLGKDAFLKCSSLQSVTFMNPKCKISGDRNTICNTETSGVGKYSGTIVGYGGSTAEEFANKYKYNFSLLGNEPLTTTTTSKTTTTTTTTTTSTTTSTTTTTTTKKPTTSTTTFVSTTTTLFSTTTTLTVSTSVSSRFFGELFMNGPTKTVYTVGEKVDYSGAKFHYYVEYEAGHVSARGGNFRDFSEISDGIYTEEYILAPVEDVSETFVITIDRSKVDTSKEGTYAVTAKITNKDGSKLYGSTSFNITVNAKASEEYELGDVNNDKHIDSVDASMVLAEYARLSSNQNAKFDNKQSKAADVNHDAKTDSNDASLILAYYAYSATLSDGEVKKSLSEFIGK